jgi:predicted transposase/invertase (TIGR01784 family)
MRILLQDAEKRGYKAGVAEGISQGVERTKVETAKNFLHMNLSIEQVAQGTGLSLETVEQLAKEQ